MRAQSLGPSSPLCSETVPGTLVPEDSPFLKGRVSQAELLLCSLQRCFSGPCMAIWVPSGSLALIRAGQLGGDPLPLSWPQKQLTVFVKKEEGKE
ncbi:unnamed protein product [Rangifer tarandus platyrhynchus]|uniref:Uncharacterized protein n=1 Tax=Rangifer tarandus platyrhynchus TaxID=3082113 RepID=A0AC59ZMB7_RANTA